KIAGEHEADDLTAAVRQGFGDADHAVDDREMVRGRLGFDKEDLLGRQMDARDQASQPCRTTGFERTANGELLDATVFTEAVRNSLQTNRPISTSVLFFGHRRLSPQRILLKLEHVTVPKPKIVEVDFQQPS
ncbi:MAG: hypothetical protein OEU92_19100, partial [Alphaproteobacteria bacterium]|nr:hypothetical protein [Alphaproteobacteria bacterium]